LSGCDGSVVDEFCYLGNMSVDGDAGVVTAVVGSSAALAAFLTAKDVSLMLR